VVSWFDNLLPDSAAIRERIRTRFKTGSVSTFDLLAAIGRDCVGAVQIVPAGMEPGDVRRIDSEPMDVTEVARTLRGVTASGVLGLDDRSENFRISIAGAQEKTALLQLDGRWHRPLGATPTTHLLKLPLGLVGNMRVDLQESVENEWLCMRLLRELGLPAAHTEIAIFRDEVGEEKALAVERFDRVSVAASAGDAPTWIARLPQEDFCQATGTPGTRKYEAEGGPGIAQCLTLLANGERPQDDALAFAKTQLAFWLLAATDGHAKNFSIFLHRDGYVMTPLYDVLSAWPVIGKGPNKLPIQKVKLAMALRGKNVHYELRKITVRHWRILAEQTGVPDAFARMTEMVDRADPALDSVGAALPAGFPEVVWDRIAAGVRAQRDIFLKALAAGA
jgi:serine/threonine-protein kinase HipA